LPQLLSPATNKCPGFREAMARFGAKLVADTLAQCRGNIQSASESLKISRSVIYHLMKKYNL
jgi:DNA-binding NtrC family response regulator